MNTNVFDEIVIVKRSGQRVAFNKAKIAIAIKKAFDSTYDEYDVNIVNKIFADVLSFIEENYKERKTISVEDIQDIIENTLSASVYQEAYEAFKQYRIKRAQSRDLFTTKQQHKFLKAMEFLSNRDVNSFNSIMNFADSISYEFARAYLLDNKYIRNHDEGNIYIQNLGMYSFKISRSAVLDLSKFEINDDYIFNLIRFLKNLKKEQYGDEVVASLDKILRNYYIYLYKNYLIDYLTKYLEAFGLLPFINTSALKDEISMLDDVSDCMVELKKYFKSKMSADLFEKALQDTAYTTNEKVARDIKNLLVSLDDESLFKSEGYTISFGSATDKIGLIIRKMIIGIFKTVPFKRLTFNYKVADLNQVDEIIDLMEIGKDFNIINLMAKSNQTKNADIEYFSKGEKIIDNINEEKRQSLGRIMLANCSINLVRIALSSKDMEDFYNLLNNYLELAKNELLVAFENMCNSYKENYTYLFDKRVILDSEKLEENQKVRKIFRGGVLYINIIGLYEATIYFSKDAKKALKLLEYLDNYAKKISYEERLNFSISSINYVDSSTHFINVDKTIFGGELEGITAKNSYEEGYKAFKTDEEISEYERLCSGGAKYVYNAVNRTSKKKNKERISEALKNEIAFINVKFGG